MSFMDGETVVTLAPANEIVTDNQLVFDGILETQSLSLVVSTVDRETILDSPVHTGRTRVRIWVNRPTEPDSVQIGLN